MKKLELLLLIIIFLGSFLVRLYRFDGPIADWHSWRQADTSAVSRNFAVNGFDVLHPRFDDLSNVPSGRDNPQGYRFVEFPLYNIAQAGLSNLFGVFSLEQWGRLVTIFASMLSMLFLYLLVKKYSGKRTGLLTAAFFGFLPFNIYYGRVILPDPTMVSAILGGIYFFDSWLSRSQLRITNYEFLLSILFTAAAFLLKPYALFFTLPMIYLALRRWGVRFFIKPQLWFFAVATIVPLVWWRIWLQQFPEGVPASDWLFNAGNIRFKGAFFYWLFADRIGRLILGYWGIAFLVLGLIRKTSKEEGLLFYTFLVSSLLYMTVIARGNVQHDYYQILIIPAIAIFMAKGVDFLMTAPKEYFSRVTCYVLLVTCCLALLGFSWYHIRDFFNINNRSIIVAGQAVDQLTPKDAQVIAPYDGDTSFLYQTGRKGWASQQDDLPIMIEKGADYLILAGKPTENDFNGFGSMFKVVSFSDQYILFDLHSKP